MSEESNDEDCEMEGSAETLNKENELEVEDDYVCWDAEETKANQVR